jgi:alpha-L-fucosidase
MLQQERLVQMGDWLKVNVDAIYGTRRWRTWHKGPLVPTYDPRLDKDWRWTVRDEIPMVHYTRKGDVLCAICLAWPGSKLTLAAPVAAPGTKVQMLGLGPLPWTRSEQGLVVEIPALAAAELPCRHAWVFALSGLESL